MKGVPSRRNDLCQGPDEGEHVVFKELKLSFSVASAGFLTVSSVDIWGWMSLCSGGCSGHCRMFCRFLASTL